MNVFLNSFVFVRVVGNRGYVSRKVYLNRLVLVWLIFTFFFNYNVEIDTAAEVHLEPFPTYKFEPFFAKIVNAFRKKAPS